MENKLTLITNIAPLMINYVPIKKYWTKEKNVMPKQQFRRLKK